MRIVINALWVKNWQNESSWNLTWTCASKTNNSVTCKPSNVYQSKECFCCIRQFQTSKQYHRIVEMDSEVFKIFTATYRSSQRFRHRYQLFWNKHHIQLSHICVLFDILKTLYTSNSDFQLFSRLDVFKWDRTLFIYTVIRNIALSHLYII